MGWPIGKLFRSDTFVLIFGGLSLVGSIGFAIVAISFWSGIIVLIVGFVCAFLLTFMLKSLAQWAAITLLIGSWLLQFFI